jgi:hypothetical protein
VDLKVDTNISEVHIASIYISVLTMEAKFSTETMGSTYRIHGVTTKNTNIDFTSEVYRASFSMPQLLRIVIHAEFYVSSVLVGSCSSPKHRGFFRKVVKKKGIFESSTINWGEPLQVPWTGKRSSIV